MATAPTPGVGRRNQENTDATKRTVISFRGESYTITPSTLPFKIRNLVRRRTGQPVEYWGNPPIVIDNVFILVWVARLQAGEELDVDDAEGDFPWDLEAGEIEITEDDGTTDDPEASGPDSSPSGPSSSENATSTPG